MTRLVYLAAVAFAAALSAQSPPEQAPPPRQQEPQTEGILPVPDYGGDLGTRSHLTGDWGGLRQDWANRGATLRLEWYQAAQGVVDGGRDERWAYGTNLDLYAALDLARMDLMPGALIAFRGQSRFGDTVNGDTGLLLPAHTYGNFPLTDPPDEDVPFAITELNYTQLFSEHFGLTAGKITTLAGKANEFSGGDGHSQFMNFQFLFPAVFAQVAPYSTLAAGAFWMPTRDLRVTTLVMNTADASTTSGFSDFGEGVSWWTSVDAQYELGGLPGGSSVGLIYAFDGDFARVGGINWVPGTGPVVTRERESWALQWTGWQYLHTEESTDAHVDPRDGRQDRQGLGVFATLGLGDEGTNPVRWACSLGLGARGVIPDRDDDTLGLGWFYNDLQEPRPILANLLGTSTQGLEAYYNVALLPSTSLTFDLQWASSALQRIDDSLLVAFRLHLVF